MVGWKWMRGLAVGQPQATEAQGASLSTWQVVVDYV
jgi:hypothetical protein